MITWLELQARKDQVCALRRQLRRVSALARLVRGVKAHQSPLPRMVLLVKEFPRGLDQMQTWRQNGPSCCIGGSMNVL